ncbi:MAG: hypothetical protein JWN43_3267 [Gammaproteobacteria bacterium]|nr:hypothetical protein [Gammaproteobacteria bacterium]
MPIEILEIHGRSGEPARFYERSGGDMPLRVVSL